MNLSVFYCKTNEMSSPYAKFFCMPQNDTMEICPTRILYAKGGEDVTVYADILFIVNLYVDALLLSAVRRFLRLPLKTGRWLLAAALGGLFGLSALLPHIRGFPLLLLGLLQALLLAAAAFAPKPPATLLKAAFLLLLFGAALSGLLSLLPFHGILLANGAVYFDISAPLLIVLTCAAYGVLYLFDRLFQKREPDVLFSTVTVDFGGKQAVLSAKVDTGLTLREPFSGLPVIVAERAAVSALLPPGFGDPAAPHPEGLRLIPYTSLGADGLLPAFRPERAALGDKPVDCWVAVSDRPLSAGSFNALVGASLGAVNFGKPGASPEEREDLHASNHKASAKNSALLRAAAPQTGAGSVPLHKRARNAAPAADARGGAARFRGHPRGQGRRARAAHHA